MASQINASNSGFGGIVSTGDSSGVLELQAAGTTIATIQSTGLNLGSNGVVFSDASTQTAAASPYVLKNRIINGDMVIDQRNAGASVSVGNGSVTFITDRWNVYEDTSGSMTSQQSSTAPAGFINSLLLTVTSAGTATASQLCRLQQRVEGLNVSDLAWGSASAKTITMSFWVRSSLTGTYCVNIRNSAVDRSYVATYTISAANTWEQKSVTIAGDTSGTWLTTNGVGMYVSWDLGTGSNANTTAGSWVAADKQNTSAQANWIGTASATFYITGVQLEIGSSATPFERRLYNQELANCQRYTQVFGGDSNYNSVGTLGIAANSTQVSYYSFPLATQLRANPSLSYSGNWRVDDGYTTSFSVTSIAIDGIALNRTTAVMSIGVASGLTSGRAYQLQSNNNTTARIILSSEL